jgi:hypothetical protein
VNRLVTIFLLTLAVCSAASARIASAQESFYQRLRSHNAAMAAVQPTWMAPLCQADTRLGQGIKFSVSNSTWASARPLVYGNNHGFSTIVGNRFQFDFDPPSYFRNHSATLKDGFGNAAAQVKYRIASGNAEHGNYAVTAVLTHTFAPRAYQNGALSSLYYPKLGVGRAFGRFSLQTMLDGMLPTAKVAAQGRAIDWNTTAQLHPNPHVWFDLEENATFMIGGPFDAATQNFVTPVVFFTPRLGNWGPGHTAVVFDAGMQIATTRFYFYNHNLITEMRVAF